MQINNTNKKYNIYYIHGYQSSPNGDKGTLFKKQLSANVIKYRDCNPEDLIISSCLRKIGEVIRYDKSVILIGSSLGGLLAASIAIDYSNVEKLILLNPAIIPPNESSEKHKDIPKRIFTEMYNKKLFEKKIRADIIILRGTEDEIVPDSWILNFAIFQEATVIFLHDDHRFSINLKRLPNIISNLF